MDRRRMNWSRPGDGSCSRTMQTLTTEEWANDVLKLVGVKIAYDHLYRGTPGLQGKHPRRALLWRVLPRLFKSGYSQYEAADKIRMLGSALMVKSGDKLLLLT